MNKKAYSIYLKYKGRERIIFESDIYGLCEKLMFHYYTRPLVLRSNDPAWLHDVMTTASFNAGIAIIR